MSKLVREIDTLFAVFIATQDDLTKPVGLTKRFPAIFKLLELMKDE